MARRRASERPASLRLGDLSDRELLWAYDRAAGESGATAQEVADEMGLNGNSGQSVAIRFGWLRRLGVMDKDSSGLWVPTSVGEEIIAAQLKKAQERQLEGMNDAQRYAETMVLTQRFASMNNRVVGDMMRRQLTHGMAQYRRRHR